jgi:hypothetical protein
MELLNYAINNESEKLELEIEEDGETFQLTFSFVERTTDPEESSPFPTGNKQVYAWPTEDIPEELLAPNKLPESLVHGVESDLPNGINLLPVPYSEAETANKSPFIDY